MKRIIYIISICFFVLGCKKEELATNQENILPWIQEKINKGFDSGGEFESVYNYDFNIKNVYLFNYKLKCCDMFRSVLFDENGEIICYPYGGISGKGDLKCTDFEAKKTKEKLIWVKN